MAKLAINNQYQQRHAESRWRKRRPRGGESWRNGAGALNVAKAASWLAIMANGGGSVFSS